MRVVDGKLIADNEDYTLEVNVLQRHEAKVDGKKFTVWRVLTDDGQLFCAAVDATLATHEQLAVGHIVVERAREALPVHREREVITVGEHRA